MKLYATFVLLVLLPTPTNAILVDIFSAILNIFFGDWQEALCDSVTDNLDDYASDCPCSVSLSGFFDFDVMVGCENIAGTGCDIGLGTEGNIFNAVFGSDSTFSGSTTCNALGIVDLSLGLEGTVGLDGAELTGCTVGIDDSVPLVAVSNCECNLGCDANDSFSAQLECDIVTGVSPVEATLSDALSLPCANVLDIIDELSNIADLNAFTR